MPPTLLCWPTTSEADVGGIAVKADPSRQYSVKFCCRDSRGAVWQNGVWHGSACEAKVCNWIPPCGKKIAPNYIHRRLLDVYGDQTMDVSTVRRWVARFSSGYSDVKDESRSGRPCTAVTPPNEERLNHFIRKNRRIKNRKLCTELNIGFNEFQTMVATLEYRKGCARWISQMLTHEHKEHRMQIGQDLLNQYEAEGVSWIASSPGTRRGVTTTSRRQNGSPWSGDMWIPQWRKCLRRCL